MVSETVGLFQAKTRLSEYVARAERGEEVIITRHNKPVAKLVAIDARAQAPAEDMPPFVQHTYDMGVPRVDLTRASALVGAQEDAHEVALMRELEARSRSEHPGGAGA